MSAGVRHLDNQMRCCDKAVLVNCGIPLTEAEIGLVVDMLVA